MTERFDITETDYEYDQEHHAYVAQFNGAMSIPDMQEYSWCTQKTRQLMLQQNDWVA